MARRLAENTLLIRFPFALVNREQLISVLDENSPLAGEAGTQREEAGDGEGEMSLRKRWDAA